MRNIFTKTGPKGIVVAVAGILTLAAVLVLIFLRVGSVDLTEDYAVVYAKGSQNAYLATPEGQFPLQGAARRQWFSPDGAYLYYGSATDGGTARELARETARETTLYLCNLKQSASRKAGGKSIAKGLAAEDAWAAAGHYAVYLEQKGKRLQCYDAQRETTQELAAGVETIYAANGQNVFFFTKLEGEDEILFRCVMGQPPERMTGAVTNPRFFADDAQAMVLYLSVSSADELSLYAIAQTGGAVLLAENPAKVFLDDYQPGGNLYFLKQGQATQAATITLDDPQAEADAAMKEPNRNDYLQLPSFLGKWFGDGGYGDALARYNKKKERDQVRAAAKEILENLSGGAAGRDCYVYDGARAQLLAKSVSEIAAMRPVGRPAVIFKRELMEEQGGAKSVGLDQLVAAYRSGGKDAVREQIAALTAREGTEDLLYTLAMQSGEGVPAEVPLEQGFGRGEQLHVQFVGDAMLYLERSALYAYTLMDYGISERLLVGSDVTDIVTSPAAAYYSQGLSNSALFAYAGANGKTTKLLQNAGAFFVGNNGIAYAYGNVAEDAGKLYALQEGEATALGEQVKIGSAKQGSATAGSRLAWLANWNAGAGELYLNGKKSARQLDTGVTEVIAVR